MVRGGMVEVLKIRISRAQSTHAQNDHQQQGFALVSVMALLPLLLASAFALSTCFYVLKRKSLAQAICIQEATRLQTNLRTPLRYLIHMNPRAQTLRRRRQIADQNLRSALSSGVPYAIAIAEAADLEVIAEQVAFRARQ